MPAPLDDVLRQQIAYYRARASEYDEWFLRQGRYDHGAEANARWFAEIAQVREALEDGAPFGNTLELACGTGLWTQQLAPHASILTVVDSSPEMLALARARLGTAPVTYLSGDLFTWEATEQYDTIFFSFWLSHVPPEQFASFWHRLARWLVPGGRIFFVDSRYDATSTASDHILPAPDAQAGTQTLTRRLNDGREFSIVKVFYDPTELHRDLRELGWNMAVRTTPTYFIYGVGSIDATS